nr:immortalization up-regulated protein isoform X2 [Peromyscus maniculatus bairdii]
MDFDLSAAVGPASKKPEGTGQVGNPKHCPPKAPGRPEAGAAHKPRHGSGSSSDSSSSSSSDSEGEGKHATGCKKHEQSSDKAKKPKVKKEKKKKKAPH